MSYTYGTVTNCKVANGQTRSEYECRLGYEVNSQSIEGNYSKVTLLLQARSINSSYKTKGSGQTTTIDGTTLSKKNIDMSSTNTWQDLGSREITIYHNSDGSCSVTKTGSFTCTAGSSNYSLRSGSASVTVNPATIPRASQPSLSASSTNIGSAVTIYMNRVSTSFTHTVRYAWGNKSGTIATGVADNVSWTLPMNFCDNIPSSTSGTGTIYVDTYSGSTLVGTKQVSFTGTVPSSVVPSISSVSISEANSAVGLDVFVQRKSQLRVKTNASGSYSSWITSCKITGIDNITYWGTEITSSTLVNSGTKTITILVTDSRGRTASTTKTYTCIAYSNPSISSANAVRCNEDGTSNDDGEYIKYTFKGTISSINNKNSKTYKVGYKLSTSDTYTYITIENDSYSIDKTDIVIPNVTFSNNNSYNIQLLIQDKYMSVAQNISVGTGFVLMNFNKSGKAMAIGKKSEAEDNEKLLEVGMPIESDGAITLLNNQSYDAITKFRTIEETEYKVKFGLGYVNNKGTASMEIHEGETLKGRLDVLTDGSLRNYNTGGTVLDSTGGTIYNRLIISKSSGTDDNCFFVTQRTDTNNKIRFGIGQGGTNRGIYDEKLNKWIFNADDSNVYINNINTNNILQKPVVAYSNSSGTSGTVTLSVSSANYKYIRITYKNSDNQYGQIDIAGTGNVGNFTTYGSIIRKNGDGNDLMINSALFNVSGSTITISRNKQTNINSSRVNLDDANYLYITKVELWN